MDPRKAALLLMQNALVEEQFHLLYVSRRWEDEESFLTMLVEHFTHDNHIRVNHYYSAWIPRYLEYDFFALFRMTRHTFETLLGKLNRCDKIYTGGGLPVPVEMQLLMTLWWLGKGEVLLSVSDKFNVCLSTVHRCTEAILDAILELLPLVIVWPDSVEVVQIEQDFRNRLGFPGVIGAIDGCNIPFKAPLAQQESYIDRYLQHSIKLQGIVTCNKIFTNIFVGFPGSAHDSRVLRNSSLFQKVSEEDGEHHMFYNNKHLIGDSAYPLHTWLLTPYKDHGNLTYVQRRYNTALSSTRIVVEHTFGILQGRWRILHFINVNSIQKAVKILTACCILHNYCYLQDDFWDDYVPIYGEDEEYRGVNRNIVATHKRNEIARQITP